MFSKGDLSVLDEIIADDFVEHEEFPGMPRDKNAPRAFVRMFRDGFSDVHASVEDIIQAGDKVTVRARITGTHDGTFMDIPATGKRIDMQVIDIVEIRDGQAVRHWGVGDMAALMTRLGLIKPAAAHAT